MPANAKNQAEGTTPLTWPWALRSKPVTSSEATRWKGTLLRRWRGTSAVMEQPPLDQHYIVMHLGGPKRVLRRRDGIPVSTIAECGSLTLVPAGTAFSWCTSGPIAFAHLYLRPALLESSCTTQFDRESRNAWLVDRVGCRDPLLEALFVSMIEEIEFGADASVLRLDSLLESCLIRLAREHAPTPMPLHSRKVALAPFRLQRVVEFIEANLQRDIALSDLVTAAGSSQFHFSRAFHCATGQSPYRYLIQRRIERARALLLTSAEPLDEVSTRCGFNSEHQFAVMFRRLAGMGPKRFRLLHRPGAPRTRRKPGRRTANAAE